MRLYRTASGGWVGTQADAKAGGRGWELVEVPTDKEGLLHWLNLNARPAPEEQDDEIVESLERFAGGERPVAASLTTPEKIEAETAKIESNWERPAPAAPAAGQTTWTATEIEDFILHRASTAQVENIFGCLGNRFSIMTKAKVELTGLLD